MTDPQYQVSLDRTANQPVSEGIHPFAVATFSEGEGNAGAYWRFDCQCLTPGEEGKMVALFLSLTPQSRWKLEIFLDAVKAPATGSVTADKFIGRKFRGQVVHGEYNGRPQAKIDQMWPLSAAAEAPVKVTRSVPPAAPAKATKAPAKAAPTKGVPADAAGENEIPF